jgi:hypothetical protein
MFIPSRELTEKRTFSREIPTTVDGTLPAKQVLCIAGKTPTCTRYAPATDTKCDGLASQYSITPAEFVEYNENVNDDCTNLVAQQSVRVFLFCTRLYAGL